MIFTTVKKRVEKEELFPNNAVMTLVDNKFSLNKKAMELFGFPMNVANTSRIANGYDENNNVILTNMDTKDMYTNNVTAKNDFASQLLSNRLSKQFKLDAILDNHFQLNLIEDDGTYKYAGVQLINAVNIPEQSLQDYPFVQIEEEELAAIETAYADETGQTKYPDDIAQQDEDIINSQSSCAEILPEPPAEVLVEVQENYVVESEEVYQNSLNDIDKKFGEIIRTTEEIEAEVKHKPTAEIPQTIISKVINTESW